MKRTATPQALALVIALGLSGFVASAQALTFKFRDISATPMSAAQLGAFQAAADYWSSKFTDNVTVYVDIGFNNLGPNILGSTGSSFVSTSYANIRGALTLDAKSALDLTAVSHLQAGPALSFMATQGDLSSRFDNDGSANNTQLGLTTANAKAMGFGIGTSVSLPDAHIVFANAYAGAFSYTRTGGTPADKIDFITVAEHELGHALGFTSGVDDIDYCAGPANRCGFGNNPAAFETDWWAEPLDLFRYSANGLMDLRVGGSPYFSIDGGATPVESFSTGAFNGNGWQASHFGPGIQTLMRPFVGNGQFYDATPQDLAAFDAIGWDVAAAVPEPETYALMLSGLALVGWSARRRQVKPA